MAQILVVDDVAQVRKLMRRTLEHAGHEVEEASNGAEAMLALHKRPVDLVITDIVMPEKEGLETIAELRRDFPEVKIIAMSGGSRSDPDDYLNLAKELGAHRVATKPVGHEELLEAVRDLLEG